MEWEWRSCTKHARRAKGQTEVTQKQKPPAKSWKVKPKYSAARGEKWKRSNSRAVDWLTGTKNKYKPAISRTDLLAALETGKRRLHTSVREVVCEDGNMSDWEAAVLAALDVCEANDALWCSHICFPPQPHVLWVNAGLPRLNTGDTVTNDVLLGLPCVRPQKQIGGEVGVRPACGSSSKWCDRVLLQARQSICIHTTSVDKAVCWAFLYHAVSNMAKLSADWSSHSCLVNIWSGS